MSDTRLKHDHSDSDSGGGGRKPTMHDAMTWCDDPICCCEAEPRWQRVAEEMGLDATGPSDATSTAPEAFRSA